MANITLKNNSISTCGDLPNIGEKAKNFCLIGKDLKKVTLNDFKGEKIVMNIFPKGFGNLKLSQDFISLYFDEVPVMAKICALYFLANVNEPGFAIFLGPFGPSLVIQM